MGDRPCAQIEGLLEDIMMFLDVIREKGKRGIPFGAVAPNGVFGGSVSPNKYQETSRKQVSHRPRYAITNII